MEKKNDLFLLFCSFYWIIFILFQNLQSFFIAEFARAVKVSTGQTLDPHVVNTVFQIFDADGDGDLSYSEFTAVMKDRLHRGFRVSNMYCISYFELTAVMKDRLHHGITI